MSGGLSIDSTVPIHPSPLHTIHSPDTPLSSTSPSDSDSDTGSPVIVERPPFSISNSEPVVPTLENVTLASLGSARDAKPTIAKSGDADDVESVLSQKSIFQPEEFMKVAEEGIESKDADTPPTAKTHDVNCVATSANKADVRVHLFRPGQCKKPGSKNVSFTEPAVSGTEVVPSTVEQGDAEAPGKKHHHHQRQIKIDVQNNHKIDIQIELKRAKPTSDPDDITTAPIQVQGCKCAASCHSAKRKDDKGKKDRVDVSSGASAPPSPSSPSTAREAPKAQSPLTASIEPNRAAISHETPSEETSTTPTAHRAEDKKDKAKAKKDKVDLGLRQGIVQSATNAIQVTARYAKQTEIKRLSVQASKDNGLLIFMGMLIAVMMYFQTLLIVLLAFFFSRS